MDTSRFRPAGRPSCFAKISINLRRKLFDHLKNPAILTGIVDLYHFTALSMILTLAGGSKVRGRLKFGVALKLFKLDILILLYCEICVINFY